MKQVNWKKLLLPNLPYVFIALFCTKLGQAARLAPGADFAGKFLHFMEGLSTAFATALPSFHPVDLCVGVAIAAAMRLGVYVKGKNAKKFRKNMEYGSARWGTADPEAARVYEEHLAGIRERNRRYKEESESRSAVDPEYAARQAELYRGRLDRQNAKKKAARAALKEKAKTDEAAAREYSEMLSAEAVVREERRTVQEQRMAEDPEYAEHIAARQKEYDRRHVERRSADLKELKAQAAVGDPEAQEKLDAHRAFYRDAQRRSQERLLHAAETDPEAAAKLEAQRQAKREQAKAYYYRKKAEKEEIAV